MTTPGTTVQVGDLDTHVVDEGAGPVVLLLHGSGSGVSALANWRPVIPALVESGHRVIAPDLIGFGQTIPDPRHTYSMATWVALVVELLDVLDVDVADVVGNSFGGALALRLAIEHPQRVRRLALMGFVGVPFELTPGLDRVWGYRASVPAMREVLDTFAFNRDLISDELAQLRYEAPTSALRRCSPNPGGAGSTRWPANLTRLPGSRRPPCWCTGATTW